MPYCKSDSIFSHKELLDLIITFKEIFCFIFYRNSSNPEIQIKVYNPEKKESWILIIDTKYQHKTTPLIKQQYQKYIEQYSFMENFENVAEVLLSAKGTVYGRQIIYSNDNSPWDSWDCTPEYVIKKPYCM